MPRSRSSLKRIACLVGVVLLISAYGANDSQAAEKLPAELPADSALLDGQTVDSIIIENRNVYNTAEPHYNKLLFRTANKLRFVTRPGVIRRELLLSEGGPFSRRLADETVRNLRVRYALYDAWYETRVLANGHLAVRIVTVDQWSLRGGLRINRDANVTNYHFGLEEMNFLGYNQFLSLYRYLPGDRTDFWDADFRDVRLGGMPVRADLAYRDNPLDDNRLLSLSHPYYSLSQRFAVLASVATRKGRRDQYRDTVRIAESQYRGQTFEAQAEYRFGEYTQKVGLAPWYRYRHEANADTLILSPPDSALVSFPDDSTYHEIGFTVSFDHPVFVATRRINGFDFTEDYTLGTSVSLSYSRAFQPGFHDAVFDHYTWEASIGVWRSATMVQLGATSDFWVDSGADTRRTSSFSFRFYQNGLSFLTLAMRGLYRTDWRRNGSSPLVVDGENGLRGHERYTETGDRAAVMNFEARFYPGVEVWSVLSGAVLFADLGRAWEPDEVWNLKAIHSAVGAGLRIGLKSVTKNDLIRIDLIKPDNGPLELAFGTGQYF